MGDRPKKSLKGTSRRHRPIVRGSKAPRNIYADGVYWWATISYYKNGPESVVQYCEQVSAKLKRDNSRMRHYAHVPNNPIANLPFQRTPHLSALAKYGGPGFSGPAPIIGSSGHFAISTMYNTAGAASDFVMSIMRAAESFFKGFASELSTPDAAQLKKKIIDNPSVIPAFPVLFGSGAVVGVLEDAENLVKDFIDLVSNIKEIAEAIYDLIKEMLADPKVAYELGKQVGTQFTKSMRKLFGHDLVRFTYELGKIVGPLLLYTVLAIFGFPYAGLIRFGAFLMEFKTIAMIVKRIEKLVPDRAKAMLAKALEKIPHPFRPSYGWKKSGMTRQHFDAVQASAVKHNRIIGVRTTNSASTPWIEKGFPAKPYGINAKTDRTGFVIAKKQKHLDEAHAKGFYVVGRDKVARRTVKKGGKEVVEEIDLKNASWPVKKGQIIPDANDPKALVGDYDLMDVIDPESMGSNVSLVYSNKRDVKDIRGDGILGAGRGGVGVETILEDLNARFKNLGGKRRAMHGAQGNFGGFNGDVVFFFPNGKSMLLKESQVKAWYILINREVSTGRHNPNLPENPSPDILRGGGRPSKS